MRTTAALIVGALLFAFVMWRATDTADANAAVIEARALLAAKDSLAAERREYTDSIEARLARAERRRETVTRYVTRTDTLRVEADSLARLEDWKPAYLARTAEADTLRLALRASRLEVEDIRVALAYSELRAIADSARIVSLEWSLSEMVRTTKPKWRDRFSVGVGYGLFAFNGTVRAGPNISASIRVWP